MIDLIFNEFLKSNIEFGDDPDVLTDEYKIYHEEFFSDEVSDEILEDIIKFRDKLVNDKFFNKFGITFDSYLENHPSINKPHPTINFDTFKNGISIINKDVDEKVLEYTLTKHNIKKENLIETVISSISIEDIVENSDIKLVKDELYDAYGSGLYEINNRKLVMFSNYDCGSFVKNSIASICCYDPITFKFELADIICNLKDKSFHLSKKQTGYMPEQYRKYHIKEFVGKRSFRWYPEENYILLRTSLEVLEKEKDIDKRLQIQLK